MKRIKDMTVEEYVTTLRDMQDKLGKADSYIILEKEDKMIAVAVFDKREIIK